MVTLGAVAFSLGSCELLGNLLTGKVEIIFSVEPGAEDQPNEIIFTDASGPFGRLRRQTLEPGENTIRVSRGGTYVIGLVHNSSGSRSIGSAISTIGNINIVSNGLDSLPTGDTSMDAVDLGPLTPGDGTFESGVGAGQIAVELGEDAGVLAEFGATDQLMTKVLNPDIDRNGVYDADEGIEWDFICSYNFYLDVSSEDFDAGIISTPISDIPHDIAWLFHQNGLPSDNDEFEYHGTNLNEDIRLYYPPNTPITDGAGNPLTYRASYYSTDWQFYFDSDPSGMNPRPPYDGDYLLNVYGMDYYLDNVVFLKPADEFQHLLLLIYSQEYAEDGTVIRASWKWKEVVDGQYADPNPEVVKLRINEIAVKWDRAGGAFNTEFDDDVRHAETIVTYWEDGTMVPSSPVNAYDMMLTFHAKDTAGNDYFFAQVNGFVPAP